MARSGGCLNDIQHSGSRVSGADNMDRMGKITRGFILLIIIGAVAGMAQAQPIKAPAVITTPGLYEMSDDARGLTDIYGIKIECSNVVIEGNGHFLGGESREKSVGVYVNQYGGSITNVTIRNLLLENWETGVDYKYVKGQEGDSNLISRCEFIGSGTGVHVDYSDFVNVTDNKIRECSTGIQVDELSTHTGIIDNEIKGVGVGISMVHASQGEITENNINTCDVYGLEVTDSEDISVIRNAISDNKYAAVKIENTKNLKINGNNLSKTTTGPVLIVGNEVHNAEITDNWFGSYEAVSVDDVSSDILWNTTLTPGTNILGGPYLGGNYWGSAPGEKGYSDKVKDTDGFGIGDTPYQINEYNIDYLPLTQTTATKAPEEQVQEPMGNESAQVSENQTPEVVAPAQTTMPTEQVTSAPTPGTNQTVNTTSTPAPLSVPVNITPVAAPIVVVPVMSNVTLPAEVPDANSSIMNRSVTNAYPSGSADIGNESEVSSENILAGSDQMVPALPITTKAESVVVPSLNETAGSDLNATSSAAAQAENPGYLLFTISEPESRVILITTKGSEISLDQIKGTNLTVPVPVEGVQYTSYRVEKNGYTAATGKIQPYPKSGETTAIVVTLSTVQQTPVSAPGNQTQQVNTSGNVSAQPNMTPVIPPVAAMPAGIVPLHNEAEPIKPALPANSTVKAVAVTNGAVEEKGTGIHTISAAAGPGGAIFPGGDISVPDGGSLSFIIDPYDGRSVTYLIVDGVTTGPMNEYRFINVKADHTILAGFS